MSNELAQTIKAKDKLINALLEIIDDIKKGENFDNIDDRVDSVIDNARYRPDVFDSCQVCGCTEFLCGHNKR